jgi:hypothetical protein
LNPIRESGLIVQLPALHSGCIVAFPRPALPPGSGRHTVSHDIRLTRDSHIAVPENCLDHDVCHPELVQVGITLGCASDAVTERCAGGEITGRLNNPVAAQLPLGAFLCRRVLSLPKQAHDLLRCIAFPD